MTTLIAELAQSLLTFPIEVLPLIAGYVGHRLLLIAGCSTEFRQSSSIISYHSGDAKWSQMNRLIDGGRYRPIACLLPNYNVSSTTTARSYLPRILVAAGHKTNDSTLSLILDPTRSITDDSAWTYDAAQRFVNSRPSSTLVTIDRRLYWIVISCSIHTGACRYDVSTRQWAVMIGPNHKRDGPLVASWSTFVYVFGGTQPLSGEPLSTCEVWNGLTNEWSSLQSLSKPRSNGTAVICNGLGILLISDDTIEVFDPQNNTYTTTAWRIPDSATAFSAAMLNGRLVIAGSRLPNIYMP
jgi:hypothetical protein